MWTQVCYEQEENPLSPYCGLFNISLSTIWIAENNNHLLPANYMKIYDFNQVQYLQINFKEELGNI